MLEAAVETLGGAIADGLDQVKRLVVVDQKPIGRTPRSNLATYTGLLDHVRRLFAATKQARARKYDAGRFSFNVAKGRCETCQGEGYVCVELLFLPSVYAPCPTCKGARYNAKTLEIKIRDKSIADVLAMNVDAAFAFFADDEALRRSLGVLREVGLGYIRLGQPATELSGGEAQRVKLATELQRAQRGGTLYVLDEPTTGLHPADVAKLMKQLDGLVEAGNTVIVIEHDMSVAAAKRLDCRCGARSGRGGRPHRGGGQAERSGLQCDQPDGQVSGGSLVRAGGSRIAADEAGFASEPIRTVGIGPRELNQGGSTMKLIFAAACVAVLSLASVGSAGAKGCIKGAIVGGVAGHMAGHGKAGAAAGCAIGHHEANKPGPNNAHAQAPDKK